MALEEAIGAFQKSELGRRSEWVGIREVSETRRIHSARDGKPESNSTSMSRGAMVEVLVDGQFGYASTPRLDIESLSAAAERAATQAESASRWAVHRFTQAQRPPTQARYRSPILKSMDSMKAGEIGDLMIQITERLKRSPKILKASAFASLDRLITRYVSSNGSNGEQEQFLMTADFEAVAQDGPVVQRRTNGGMRGRSYQGGWEYLYADHLWERVDRVAEQALELLTAPECPDETGDLVLMPDQMMLQIHESIGHPLELDRILGDERNYAGWSFVKTSDFGQLQYGSKLMNVTFDPTVENEFASYAFDDTGTRAERHHLIREGKLVRALGGLESQARSGIPGVANMRASSWNRAPIDRMANINLEPGNSSWDEIIGSIDRGVIMESNRSWSIDDFRNKFQFGCEYGRRVENGKITGAVRNPNYRGITVPFWTQLAKVGNLATTETYGTPNCGKGEPNQVIKVGHRSPVCLFKNVEMFGGAK